jgi:polar amino acid transport system substrate-binding protein
MIVVVIALAAITTAGQGVLRWAGDPEGGAPFVEADPSHPDRVVGFDVEIAALLAAGVGRAPEFLNITFTSIDQSIARGDAEVGLSGIEDTPARRTTMAVTLPYYEFREVRASATPTRRVSRRSPICGARPWARSPAPSRTRSCCAPSASTVCTWCRTKMTSIPTATS